MASTSPLDACSSSLTVFLTRELDKLTQDEERLEKSFSALAFYMDRQQEEWTRCVNGNLFGWTCLPTPRRSPFPSLCALCADMLIVHLLFELGGMKQDAERHEKSSFVCTFFMVKQEEE